MARTNNEHHSQAVQRMLTIEQVCELLGVAKTFVYRRTCKGHPDPIPAYRLGGHLRFQPDEIDAWIQVHRLDVNGAVDEAVAETIYLDRPKRSRNGHRGRG